MDIVYARPLSGQSPIDRARCNSKTQHNTHSFRGSTYTLAIVSEWLREWPTGEVKPKSKLPSSSMIHTIAIVCE